MMKKLRLLFTVLMLTLLGSNAAWSQEVTYDFTSGWSASDGTLTDGTVTILGNGSDNFKINNQSGSVYFFMGKTDAYITLPAYDFDVASIEVVGRSGASASTKMNVFVGNDAVSTETTGCTGTNTYEILEDYQTAGTQYTLKVTSNHNAQITAIKIYKVGSAVTPTISITPANVSITGDESVALTVNVSNYEGDITFTSAPEGAATVTKDATGAYSVTATANAVVTATLGDTGVSTTFNVTYYEPVNPDDVRWSEDFSGDNPLSNYTVTNGGTTTKLYNETNAGGTSPELLISKTNGTFVATIDLQGYYGNMTLTFKANYQNVTVSAEGGTLGDVSYADKLYTIPVTVQEGTEELTLTFTNLTSNNVRVDDFLLSGGTKSSAPVKQNPNLSFGVTETSANLGEPFTAPALTYAEGFDGTIVYESSNTSVAAIDVSTGEVSILAVGTTTITASSEATNNFKAGEVSYTLTVIDPNTPGTENNPYTVAQARAAIDAGTGVTGVYATGIVSEIVTAYNSQYGNISYNISSDGSTTAAQLQAYRGKSYNGDNFTSADDIQVGDVVVIYGNLTKYGETYEFAQNNQLVSLERPEGFVPSPTFNPAAGNIAAGSTVAIVCPDEADGVEYSFDQQEWTEYTDPIEITETTTIYARAYDEDGNYSDVVSATYTVVVPSTDKYELVTDASTLAAGDEILLAYVDSEVAQAMSAEQGTNNRPAVDVIYNDDGTLTPNSDAQVITLEDAVEAWNFNVGNGYLYAASSDKNWLKTEEAADDNAKATIEIDENGDAAIIFQGSNTRNHMRYNANNGSPMFSCYAETSSIKTLPRIYRKVNEEVISVTIGDAGYATLYYKSKALEIPEGVTASIVTSVDKGITFEELEGVIPCGTGVVLQGAAGNYEFKVTEADLAAPTNNMLKGSDEAAKTEGENENCKFYQLSLNADDDPNSIGFYWGAENGGVFTNGAHKAYLVVSENQNPAKSYSFNGLVTAIRGISTVENAEIYTIGGVRVSGNNLPKGIYIVNGKKMVVK